MDPNRHRLVLLRRPGRNRIYSGRERRRVIQYIFPRIYARQHYAPPRARVMSFLRSRKVLRNLSLRKFSHSSRGTGECHGEMIGENVIHPHLMKGEVHPKNTPFCDRKRGSLESSLESSLENSLQPINLNNANFNRCKHFTNTHFFDTSVPSQCACQCDMFH